MRLITFPRITVAMIADVVWYAGPRFRERLLEASAKSPMLAAAFAGIYPLACGNHGGRP